MPSSTPLPSGGCRPRTGIGLFADSVPNVYDANYLSVEDARIDAAAVAAETDALMERFHHRRVIVDAGRRRDRGRARRARLPVHDARRVRPRRAAGPPGRHLDGAGGGVRAARSRANRGDGRGAVGRRRHRRSAERREAADHARRPDALLRRDRSTIGSPRTARCAATGAQRRSKTSKPFAPTAAAGSAGRSCSTRSTRRGASTTSCSWRRSRTTGRACSTRSSASTPSAGVTS